MVSSEPLELMNLGVINERIPKLLEAGINPRVTPNLALANITNIELTLGFIYSIDFNLPRLFLGSSTQ